MSVSEFKRIFYYEWAHRVLGRAIGVAFAVPFLYFGAKGYLNASLKKRLAVLFTLGGAQGLVGWWMVKSGLDEDLDHPRVSPYRYLNPYSSSLAHSSLAFHLGTAFTIYVMLLQTALSLTLPVGKLAAAKAVSPMMKVRLSHSSDALFSSTGLMSSRNLSFGLLCLVPLLPETTPEWSTPRYLIWEKVSCVFPPSFSCIFRFPSC